MKKHSINIFIGLLIFTIMVLLRLNYNNKYINSVKSLYTNHLNGNVVLVFLYSAQNHFKLDNDPNEYFFVHGIPNRPNFSELAKVGDRIYKNANSDTIYLIHNNEKYTYVFSTDY